jgi:hypothetical protein
MAISSIVVHGGTGEVASAIVAAVTGAGGTIPSQVPAQPIRFTIKGRAGDNWFKRIAVYTGSPI